MTEKVVSLSSGLVLGMAFALFLSVSTTQTMTSPLHLDYPSVSGLISLNDLQSYHTSSSPASGDTTPSISVAPPQDQGQGRIIRIATVTETTDPILAPSASSQQDNLTPKNWSSSEAPKAGSTLQQMHLQHSYIASSSQSSYATVGLIARQTNFTAIADNGSGSGGQMTGGGEQPSVIDNKPQVSGSPAIAQGNPGSGEEGENEGEGEGEGGPAMASFSPRPPAPDTLSDNQMREEASHGSPDFEWNNSGLERPQHDPQSEPGYGSQMHHQHRPEVD